MSEKIFDRCSAATTFLLTDYARGTGYVSAEVDPDHVVRWLAPPSQDNSTSIATAAYNWSLPHPLVRQGTCALSYCPAIILILRYDRNLT